MPEVLSKHMMEKTIYSQQFSQRLQMSQRDQWEKGPSSLSANQPPLLSPELKQLDMTIYEQESVRDAQRRLFSQPQVQLTDSEERSAGRAPRPVLASSLQATRRQFMRQHFETPDPTFSELHSSARHSFNLGTAGKGKNLAKEFQITDLLRDSPGGRNSSHAPRATDEFGTADDAVNTGTYRYLLSSNIQDVVSAPDGSFSTKSPNKGEPLKKQVYRVEANEELVIHNYRLVKQTSKQSQMDALQREYINYKKRQLFDPAHEHGDGRQRPAPDQFLIPLQALPRTLKVKNSLIQRL